jgi:predicted RNA binding protein YcfA (HicA-like mRNA interferase family)
MPKLRRLTGKQVVAIMEGFGFEVIRIRGSHHHMRRIVEDTHQNLNVPIHGNKPLPTGTLNGIYRQAKEYIPERDLKSYFYTD